jgi:hypothetical protein
MPIRTYLLALFPLVLAADDGVCMLQLRGPEADADEGPLVLFAVTSGRGPEYTARREAVRKSWGAELGSDKRAMLRFFVGKSDAGVGETESDVVELHDLDNYADLTNKTVHLLEWSLQNTRARYVMKVDDDVFLRVNDVLTELGTQASSPPLFWGRVHKHSKPERDPKGKYYLGFSEYRNTTFPPFVTGNAYVLSRDVVERLVHQAETHIPWIHLEDVQMGLWARDLNLWFRDDPERFLCCGDSDKKQWCQENALAVHYVQPARMVHMQEKLNANEAMCKS